MRAATLVNIKLLQKVIFHISTVMYAPSLESLNTLTACRHMNFYRICRAIGESELQLMHENRVSYRTQTCGNSHGIITPDILGQSSKFYSRLYVTTQDVSVIMYIFLSIVKKNDKLGTTSFKKNINNSKNISAYYYSK